MHPHQISARDALRAWQESRPGNYFEADLLLRELLIHQLGESRFAAERPGLSAFGAEVAGIFDGLCRTADQLEHLPKLTSWDGLGERTEGILFHPAHDELGRRIYRTGIVSRSARPGQETTQLTLAYLVAHHGAVSHLFSISSTLGLIRLLNLAEPGLRERFLPGLLRDDYAHPAHLHAAHALTELQGGSDLGGSACAATLTSEPGLSRLSGDKWFVAAADADLFLVTARAEGTTAGTAGLSFYLAPRRWADGRPNVRTRRLKPLVGARGTAMAEMDFTGSLAFRLNPALSFGQVAEAMLDTGRLFVCGVGCGLARRAVLEAELYAQQRRAFGRPLREHAAVARHLERAWALVHAATAGTFALAALRDRIARGEHGNGDEAVARLVATKLKPLVIRQVQEVVQHAVEILGGNGLVEDFSVLPRLARDAMVLHAWQGSPELLAHQVVRDLSRTGAAEAFFDFAEVAIEQSLGHPLTERVVAAVTEARTAVAALFLGGPLEAELGARPLAERLALLWEALALLAVPDSVLAAETLTQILGG